MIKNLTRKGLALGTSTVLALSALVGIAAPAQASNLTVLPTAGTSTSFVSGETFKLKVIGQSFVTSDALRWEIKNPGAAALTIAATGGTASPTSGSGTTITVTPAANVLTPGGNELHLTVGATVAATVQVRAYIESGDAVGYTSLDTAFSAPVSVSFLKIADVTSAIVLDAVTEGDDSASATAQFTNINNEQMDETKLRAVFTYADGTSFAGYTQTDADAWDADDKFVVGTGTFTSGTLTKDKAVKAQFQYNSTGSTWVNLASTSSVVTARKVATATADVVKSATATPGSPAQNSLNKEFQVKLTVKDNATTPAAVAGVAVRVSVRTGTAQSNSIDLGSTASAKKLTVNGVTYTDKTKLPGVATTGAAKIAVVTDAAGVATVTLKTDNFVASDNVSVMFEYENESRTIDVESATPTYKLSVLNGATQAILAKGTATLNVAVYDQFGGLPADGSDVRAIWASGSRTGTDAANATATSNVNVPLVGGKATLSITDNGTGIGTSVYGISVETRVAGGGYAATPVVASANYTLQVVSAALVAGAITLTNGAAADATTKVYARSGTLSPSDNGAFDARGVLGTAPEHANWVELDGNAKTAATATAAQANVPNAAVTLSGAGLQFKTAVATLDGTSKDVYAADSITVYADASGNYVADVASNKAGKQTVTITSGGASRTVVVTFSDAAANTGTSIVITATDFVSPGSTVSVSAKLTDKYGNPVAASGTANDSTPDFKFSYTGPGLLVGSAPTAFAADGTAKVGFFLGANDTGSITVVFQYDKNGDNDFTDAGDLVVQKSITIGAAETKVAAFTKRKGDTIQVVSQGSAKVAFFLNGKRVASRQSLGTLNRTFDLVDGKNVIEIYVDGKRQLRRAATK